MRHCILGVVLLFIGATSFGQKQTETEQQVWGAFFNQTRFSDKWGLWADFHIRTKEDFLTDLSSTIARLGLTYHVNDNTRLTAGYGYVTHYPAAPNTGIAQPEHRPWQQIQWNTGGRRSRLVHGLRLEERYRRKLLNANELADEYDFNFRLRYNLLAMFAMGRKAFAPNTMSFVINDEVMLNFGEEVVYNYFDQNRLFFGFAYHINRQNTLQFGYMNVFIQTAAGNRYRSLHVPRVFYFNNIDLRKRKKLIRIK